MVRDCFPLAIMLGRNALGLSGSANFSGNVFGLNPVAPPTIVRIYERGERTEAADRDRDKFVREHQDHRVCRA
jgi:hypothetical protein